MNYGFGKKNIFGNSSVITGLIDKLKSREPQKAVAEEEAVTPAQVQSAADNGEAEVTVSIIGDSPAAEESAIMEESFDGGEESFDCGDSGTIDLSMDWDAVFSNDSRAAGIHVDSISDGLVRCLSDLGKVDIEYISAITGEDMITVISALKGSIYQNPETWENCYYKGWETADEYLSGYVMRKWRAAKHASEVCHGNRFSDNVKTLERILPAPVSRDKIFITLESPLVTPEMIDAFITHILNLPQPFEGTVHDEITGAWDIPNKSSFHYNVRSYNTYGTKRMEALYILERTLNRKSVPIYDERVSLTSSSGKKRVLNKLETAMALEHQKKMKLEFMSWVWTDIHRCAEIETAFENKFGCVRRRNYDGSFLSFPTMNPAVELYPYQKNAVARILFSPNTLLAHDVGSGKTYVMIAAGMELRRMGLSRKNLYCVPNTIVGQWRQVFEYMYPDAKVLTVEPKDFAPKKRHAVLKKIRDEEYDGIIMAYSCLDNVPLSLQSHLDSLIDQISAIDKVLSNKKKATKSLKKKRDKLSDEYSKAVHKLNSAPDGESVICFDDLGITRIFIDEAHNFKNVPFDTKIDKVLGISSAGSKKCGDMMDKVHYVQRMNNGGGAVLATGTPITNSITDAYIMQLYLQSGELALLDIHNFDAWAGLFAERETNFEIDVDTMSYRLATRFSKFHNLPELTAMLSTIADFHRVDSSAGIPEFDGYTDCIISRTPSYEKYLKELSRRAEACRSGLVPRTEDNMLMITTDARLAALDERHKFPNAGFTYQSKVARCAENVTKEYFDGAAERATQLVFCDSSTPKPGFNMYHELKRLLISMGIPEEHIAFIHDATTERKREALFKKVRDGEIRVLMGSTFKLGLGVNVQDRMIALHHLDIPWRPADMTQREGRILRQGNRNKKVRIYRYITEGSFDAYSWQLLETKQRFISELLSGSLTERHASDIDSTVLSYAEVKALAVGNPLVKKRVETANEFNRCLALQKKLTDQRISLEHELSEIPAQITHQEGLISKCRMDIAHYRESIREYSKDQRRLLWEKISAAVKENVLAESESVLMKYQGFDIVLPANMREEKPFLWLVSNGRYYVEMGESDKGMLIRIDNFLEGLEDHLDKLTDGLELLCNRKESIEAELAKDESYTDMIEKYRSLLAKIDEELGIAI